MRQAYDSWNVSDDQRDLMKDMTDYSMVVTCIMARRVPFPTLMIRFFIIGAGVSARPDML